MKSTILGLLAVGLLAGPTAANAAVQTYDVSGTFAGGGTFSGSFSLYFGTTACDYDAEFVSANVTTSSGHLYDIAFDKGVLCDYGTGEEIAAISMKEDDSVLHPYLILRFSPWILASTTSFAIGGYEAQGSEQKTEIETGSGTLRTSVPEPGTLALLGLGLAGLGLSRRRRAN